MWTVALTRENGDAMAFEMTVGLFVSDPEMYSQYRAEIAPLVEAAGARFRFDFEIARTLKSDANHEINRVFVLQFPDGAGKEEFFANPRYIEIRARLFARAVKAGTTISEFER